MYKTLAKIRQRRGCWIPLILLLLLALWLAFTGWRIYTAARSLETHMTNAQALLPENGDLSAIDPDALSNIITGTREDVVSLKRHTWAFMWLTPLLKPLPKVGALAAEAPDLLDIADAGTNAAVTLLPDILTGLSEMDGAVSSPIALLAPIVRTVAPQLPTVREDVTRITTAYNQIEYRDELPWRVRELLPTIDMLVPLADQGVLAAQLAPELLGTNGRRTFLIIAQNPWEIRATGGFISGVGELVIENGEIIKFDFGKSEAINLRNYQLHPPEAEYGEAPPALHTLMGLDYWLFQDSNFYPEFRLSAEKALELYEIGTGVVADGVVAVDLYMLENLITATGPLTLGDGDEITGRNVVQLLQEGWAGDDDSENRGSEWLQNRKAFLGDVASVLLAKLMGDLDPETLAQVLNAVFSSAEQKHLQIYSRDEATQAAAAQIGWDGPLIGNPDGDLLRLVETNVGYNKVNAIITRDVEYEVVLHEDRPHDSSLTIHYTNGTYDDGESCSQQKYERYIDVEEYTFLIRKCYYNYLRFYLPPSTVITETTSHPVAGRVFENAGRRGWDGSFNELERTADHAQFETFLLVPKAKQVSTIVSYTHDDVDVSENQYDLYIPKQAGMTEVNYTVRVTLPESADANSAAANYPIASIKDGKMLTFEMQGVTDMQLIVSWD